MEEIRRSDDNELCGFVDDRVDGWHALTVFGGVLGVYPTRQAAQGRVRNDGLASMMERWTLVDHVGGDEQVVCIQEVRPDALTVVLGYYAVPGVPTLRIERADLDAQRWTLRRE